MSLVQLPDSVEADCDLVLRVRNLLHQRGYEPLRTLQISVEQGAVVVRGTVPAYYLRQVAVECARRVAGVNRLIDRIEVEHLSPSVKSPPCQHGLGHVPHYHVGVRDPLGSTSMVKPKGCGTEDSS